MEYSLEQEAGQRIVRLEGALDVSQAIQLRNVLAEQLDGPAARVLVDLSAVRIVDSSGVGILVTAHRLAEKLGARIVLAGAQPAVRRVFELTRTDRLLRIVPTLAEGSEALDAP